MELVRFAPNPLVGCVITHKNQTIAEGWHENFGGNHAEIQAINKIVDKGVISECILYVNLEPCAHFGKTPPCVDRIIKEGFKHVVIGAKDPNPVVSGNGILKLKQSNIQVEEGICKDICIQLNNRFYTYHLLKRPYIILKWAESKDGFINTNESKQTWLTGAESKKLVHKWRSEEMAIMVGANTVLVDDPELTTRLVSGNNPVRVVFDKDLSLSKNLKIFNSSFRTLVFNYVFDKQVANIEYIKIKNNSCKIQEILKVLNVMQINSLIIEGGTKLLSEFISKNLWDEARVFVVGKQLVSGIKAPKLHQKHKSKVLIGNDLLKIYDNSNLNYN